MRIIALAVVSGLGTMLHAAEYKKSAGPHEVGTLKLEWKDAKRDRTVPVKIYLPKSAGPFPVIIFSHGLGGSRDGYEYLGRHWASHGYVCVHLQHHGSDSALWVGKGYDQAALRKAASDPKNAADRPQDVHFAIDELTKLNASDSQLKGRLNLNNIGMAGHSFGAYTTM